MVQNQLKIILRGYILTISVSGEQRIADREIVEVDTMHMRRLLFSQLIIFKDISFAVKRHEMSIAPVCSLVAY